MNFIPEEREENTPYFQLLMIAAYALAGMLLGTLLSVIYIAAVEGLNGLTKLSQLNSAVAVSSSYLNILRISQVLTTGCLFILPTIWLARQEKIKFKVFYGFKKPDILLLLLVFILMTCSAPMMEWVGLANQKMVLPDFMKAIQDWMRAKEDEAMKMTILLLKSKNIGDYIINMLVIAVLPAVAEELFFRGAIQRSFKRMFNNPHVAIWVTAFIFSAIHMQFYGFFPRLLLGAGFGYIYFWTGSLWYAMFAHFLNNGYAVTMTWYMQAQGMSLTDADNTANFKWYGYLISLILTIILLIYFKNKTTQQNGKQLG